MQLYEDESNYRFIALVLGTISMILWLIPMIGVFTSMGALYSGSKVVFREDNGFAVAGIAMGILGGILTVLRSGLVYYYG